MLASLYFKWKGKSKSNPSQNHGLQWNYWWHRRELYERFLRIWRNIRKLSWGQFSESQTYFYSDFFVMLSKDADGGIHWLSPEEVPGLLLPNSISLQILKTSGTKASLLKSASLLPSRWHCTHSMEMLRKRFLLWTKRNTFFPWSPLPLSLPPQTEAADFCKLPMTSSLHCLCSWQILCSRQIRIELSGVYVSTGCLSNVPAGSRLPTPLQTCFWVSLFSAGI